MKKIALISALVLASGMTLNAQAHPNNEGYFTDGQNDEIVRTGFGGCWRHGFWEEENAVEGCEGYVKPEPVAAPAPAPVAAPAPAPAAPEFKDMMVKEDKVVYFAFDSAVVDSVAVITEYLPTLDSLDGITLVGYTDKFGSQPYNMQLSKSRVEAVEAALIEAGVDASLISTDYFGESNPVTDCSPATKECLAENRRVTATIEGYKRVEVK